MSQDMKEKKRKKNYWEKRFSSIDKVLALSMLAEEKKSKILFDKSVPPYLTGEYRNDNIVKRYSLIVVILDSKA